MQDRPENLDEDELRRALRGWEIDADSLEHLPVGFGDPHWSATDARARRWFVTVADLTRKGYCGAGSDAAFDGLRHAMDTASALQAEGLDFVVAPLRTGQGQTMCRLGPDHGVSVFPFVTGKASRFGRAIGARERGLVVDLLARLHRAAPPPATPVFQPQLATRPELERAFAELDRSWSGGPYAEPARARLSACASAVRRRLAEFDQQIEELAGREGDLVVTHGEPHPGNLLRWGGRLVLVDWDTVGLAWPERDLWMVCRDPADLRRYEAATGRAPDPSILAFHRLRWILDDIAIYVGYFRSPHGRTPDAELSWKGLCDSLDAMTGPAKHR